MKQSPCSIIRGLLISLAVGLAAPAVAQRSSVATPASPLTLRALLDAVRDGHPTILAADARVRAAEGTRRSAGRFGNPVLSYQVENTGFPTAGAVPGIDRETMEMAMVPLEALYLRGTRLARTAAEARATRADADRARQRVALDASGAFYRVALARVAATTEGDLVSWLDSLLVYNRARAREGVMAEADLLRSALERDRAAAEATMADAELAQASAQLASYLGVSGTPGFFDVLAGELPLAAPTVPAPQVMRNDSLVERGGGRQPSSISLRPDVRAAREREAAATAGISTERRRLFREMAATIGVKQMMGTNSMIAGLSLPFPLFDQNRGEVARATAERDIARYELAAQERLAYADVIGTGAAERLLTIRTEAMAVPGPEGLLARADEMRRIALGAYREGAIPLVQVLDAARVRGETRVTFYRTLYAQHQIVLALVVANGGDLFTAPLTPVSRPSR